MAEMCRKSEDANEKGDENENKDEENNKGNNEKNIEEKNIEKSEESEGEDEESCDKCKKRCKRQKLSTGDPEMDELLTGYLIDTVNELFEDKRRALTFLREREKLEEEKLKEEKELEALAYGPKFYTDRERKFIILEFDKVFTSLKQLIDLGETFDPSIIYISNINMLRLKLVLEHIKSLNGMIGMESLKSTILKQLLTYILNVDY